MDWPQLTRSRARVTALVAGLTMAACGGASRSGHGVALDRPGDQIPSGLAYAKVHARGVLAYGAAQLDHLLVSVELSERFALVLRQPGAAVRTIDLGPPDYDIEDLAVDRARGQAWVASADGSVRGYRVPSGKAIATYRIGQRATALALAGSYIATGSAKGVLCLRRRRDGALLQCVAAHGATLSSLDFSANGRRLLSASHDGSVTVWSVPSLAIVHRTTTPASINHARFSPGGERVGLAISGSPPVRVPAQASKEPRHNRSATPQTTAALAIWTPGKTPRLTPPLRLCRGHHGPVVSLAWTQDAEHLLTGSWDRTVRLWRADDCRQLAKLSGFAGRIKAIDLAPGRGSARVSAWVRDLDDPSVVTVEILYAPPRSRP